MGTETEIGKGGQIQCHSLVDMLISNNEGIIVVMEGNHEEITTVSYEITIIPAVTVTGILLLLE